MCVADVSYTFLDADRVDSTTLLGKWCFYFHRKFHNTTKKNTPRISKVIQ